jgi:sugar phosphate permease
LAAWSKYNGVFLVLVVFSIFFMERFVLTKGRGKATFSVEKLFFFFVFSLQPMMNVLLAQRTTLDMRGTAFGIYFFAAFGVGSLAASFSGYIAQTFGLPSVFLALSGGVLLLIFITFAFQRLKEPGV